MCYNAADIYRHLSVKNAFYEAGKTVNIERYIILNCSPLLCVYLKYNIKLKAYPYTALERPLRIPGLLDNRHMKVAMLLALSTVRISPPPPGDIPRANFC